MRVLDLGCGDGKTPQKLGLPSGWKIVGVDMLPVVAGYSTLCEHFPNVVALHGDQRWHF